MAKPDSVNIIYYKAAHILGTDTLILPISY